jgi:hypothetical protein
MIIAYNTVVQNSTLKVHCGSRLSTWSFLSWKIASVVDSRRWLTSGLQVLQNDQDLDKTSYQSWYDAKRKANTCN